VAQGLTNQILVTKVQDPNRGFLNSDPDQTHTESNVFARWRHYSRRSFVLSQHWFSS